MLNFVLFFIISCILLIWFKYHIDTGLTIKEIKKDRDRYRQLLSNLIEKQGQEKTDIYNSEQRYNNLKIRIENFIKDIEETDFEKYPNIKQEFISALLEIEFYGDTNDKG
jgi:hypothetical protein